MSTIVAEFFGGPRDGDVRALPALLPSWQCASFDPATFLQTGSPVLAKSTHFYDLVYDDRGDPVKDAEGVYHYQYRRPE